jgi:hypothetical protein
VSQLAKLAALDAKVLFGQALHDVRGVIAGFGVLLDQQWVVLVGLVLSDVIVSNGGWG